MNNNKPEKLGAADIAAVLRREIAGEILHLHDRLPPERRLAGRFGVARGTVREALNRLASEGLVEVRAGSGTYVVRTPAATGAPAAAAATDAPVEHATPLELMDARFAIEPHVCRLAVLHGRRADFDALEALCTRMEHSTDDPAAFSAADTRFHRRLVECTRNGLLIWIVDQMTSVRGQAEWTKMRRLTLTDEIIALYNQQHCRILDAIRAREPDRAANLMKEHLETARLSLTRAAET